MKVKDSRDDLSQCGCDTCDCDEGQDFFFFQKKNSVQACSVLHVAHVLVGVRRVTVVQIGLEGVLVVIHFCLAIFVRDLLYQEIFSLHPPSVTVDCVDCYRKNHDKLCIKFLLRFMPQMNSWFTEYTGFPVRSVFNPSLW